MTDLAGKRLELLREIQPSLHAIAFLGSARDPNTATFVRETQTAADQLGVALSVRSRRWAGFDRPGNLSIR